MMSLSSSRTLVFLLALLLCLWPGAAVRLQSRQRVMAHSTTTASAATQTAARERSTTSSTSPHVIHTSGPVIRIIPAARFNEPMGVLPFFNRFVANQRKGFPFPEGHECEADAHTLCPGILRRCVGDFGCSMQCLTDHAPKLSDGCRKAHPCFPDIDRFCVDVEPGENQMMHCLRRHISDLSEECVAHHPCLKQENDEACKVLDYSGPKTPSFVGNLGDFLKSIRTGRIFKSLLGEDDDDLKPNMPSSSGADDEADDDGSSKRAPRLPIIPPPSPLLVDPFLAAEKRHIETSKDQLIKEREQLLSERKELAEERKQLQAEKDKARVAAETKAQTEAAAKTSLLSAAGRVSPVEWLVTVVLCVSSLTVAWHIM